MKANLDQHAPFIDVFKTFNTFNSSIEAKKGNVQDVQDHSIGRKIFQISGNVQAANYISIPDPLSDAKSLNLPHRYIYLEFWAHLGKIFSIHLDFSIVDREQIIRFSLSNLYDAFKLTAGNVLQIPLKKEILSKWTILVLDVELLLGNFNFFPPGAYKSFKNIFRLKSAQICSNLSFRNIYTSNYLYDLKTLPREMNFKILKEGQKWEEIYQFIYIPKEISVPSLQVEQKFDEEKENIVPKISSIYTASQKKNEINKSISQQHSKISSPVKESTLYPTVKEDSRYLIPSKKTNILEKTNDLEKEPYLKLNYSLAFSGKYCPDIKWMKTLEGDKELIYASGSLIVVYNVEKNTQRFFYGHTEPVVCLDIYKDNEFLVSAQEGKKCLIKIWTPKDGICISTIQPPYESIKCTTFSSDKKLLCTVGYDNLRRQVIIVWDLENIYSKKKADIIAKQISDFDIISIKFSPIEADKLVSCGKENIRFWRLKNDHIPGGTVVLNHHARNSVFTVLDFEFTHDDPQVVLQQDKLKRVFVGTKNGWLYQINYFTRQMEGIYQVHDSAICSLCISPGFCVSGSEDQFLRVWPLDFSEFILEAKHEGIVLSLDISLNGLEVACGTSTGGLAILDLGNQNYKTIMRAHTEEIVMMEMHEPSNSFITLSRDLTIRIWDINKLEQNYEFSYPKEDMCICISGMPNGNYFVGGFESGTFRVFDIEKICIVEECKFHEGAIKFIQYSPNGKFVLVGDKNCFYCIYDVMRNYQPVKTLPRNMNSDFIYGAFSPNNELFCTIGDNGSHINVYETYNLTQLIKIFCSGTFVKRMKFHKNSEFLFVITLDCKIRIYSLQNDFQTYQMNAYFIKELNCLHRDSLNDVAIASNNRFLFTVGSDNLIKIWEMGEGFALNSSPQVFIGHSNPVNTVILSPSSRKILTAGGFEGVYIWNSMIDLGNNSIDLNFDYTKLVPIAKRRPEINMPVKLEKAIQDTENSNEYEAQKEEDFIRKSEFIAQNLENEDEEIDSPTGSNPANKEIDIKLSRKDSIKKMSEFRREVLERSENSNDNFIVEKLPEDFKPFIREFKKLKARKYKESFYSYKQNEVRTKFNLPFKHYYLERKEQSEMILKEKLEKIKNNTQNLELQYLIGYNNDGHQNLIWNYMSGWFAYSIENMIIIEKIDKERQQKVINFPDLISVLTLSRDGHILVIGSAHQNSENLANIYLMDCSSHVVVKTLSFHTRGVQQLAFTNDGKYLISIGNFRESTVAIWEFATGKLLASSYTLDKINDIKVSSSCYVSDRVFEFCTVGRDQVQFWAFVKDFKHEYRLEYYDVFVKKSKDELAEITCCDYVKDRDDEYVICGLSSGEIAVVQYKTFQVIFQKKITESEIVDMFVSQISRKIICSALDSSIYFLEFDRFVPTNLHFYKFQTTFPPSSLSIEPELNEGLYATIEGGIYYFNIAEKFTQCLSETLTPSRIYKTFYINEEIFMVVNDLNKVSLWNIDTAELLHSYNFKSQLLVPFYIKENNKIICLFENNNEIHILSLNKLGLYDSYINDQLLAAQKKGEDFPVKMFSLMINGKKRHYILLKKGEIYDYSYTEKEYSVILDKVSEIPDIEIKEAILLKEDFMIIGTIKGVVNVYQIEKKENCFSLYLYDTCNYYDNPYSDKLNQQKENLIVTQKLYENALSNIKVTTSKYNEGCYFSILDNLQYIYERNFIKRQTTKKIPLNDFPLFLNCIDDKNRGILYVALQDGSIYYMDAEDLENLSFRSFLNGPINSLITVKKKNKIIAFHNNGICFYNFIN